MRAAAWLRLGRISNLPTVWSNALAAVVLSGSETPWEHACSGAAVVSLFYVAGMFLNDAFDAAYDRQHRPSRPIPAGEVSQRSAFVVGFLGMGLGSLAMVALAQPGARLGASYWALALAGCICFYDVWHKNNPFGPVVMGACRALVFAAVAWMHRGYVSSAAAAAALLQWAYIVGLTYAAKQEDLQRPGALWPVALVFSACFTFAFLLFGGELPELSTSQPRLSVADGARPLTAFVLLVFGMTAARGLAPLFGRPRAIGVAVGRLIAGISVLDALLLASAGNLEACVVALGFAALTSAGQRWIPGT